VESGPGPILWYLEQQIVGLNEEIEQIASSDPACQRLRQIPGIGPLVATAIVAAIGNGAAFRRGREFSSWLGLVPRQHSTGGKARLFGISKRGNRYLRKLLVHGARSAPRQARAIPVRSMARHAGDPSADQRGNHSGSQQAGSHRLGRSIKRPGLSRSSKLRGCLRRRGKDAFGLEALIALPLSRTTTTI